jgi:hypothetical protein
MSVLRLLAQKVIRNLKRFTFTIIGYRPVQYVTVYLSRRSV